MIGLGLTSVWCRLTIYSNDISFYGPLTKLFKFFFAPLWPPELKIEKPCKHIFASIFMIFDQDVYLCDHKVMF